MRNPAVEFLKENCNEKRVIVLQEWENEQGQMGLYQLPSTGETFIVVMTDNHNNSYAYTTFNVTHTSYSDVQTTTTVLATFAGAKEKQA